MDARELMKRISEIRESAISDDQKTKRIFALLDEFEQTILAAPADMKPIYREFLFSEEAKNFTSGARHLPFEEKVRRFAHICDSRKTLIDDQRKGPRSVRAGPQPIKKAPDS